jgi:HlyD family secretion protein
MNAKTWSTLTVILLVVAGAVALAIALAPPMAVETATVKRGPIREYVDERAKTRLPRTHLITMPVAGRIEEITLTEGTSVRKGQPVAQIVPLDLKLDVEEANAVVQRLDAAIRENAEKNVELTGLAQSRQFVASMRDTVKAAAARVESGRARADYAEKSFARVAPLAKTGAKTEDELDQITMQKVESNADLRQDQLVHSAMVALEAATNLLPTMIEQYIGNKALDEAVLMKQKAEATAQLRRIERNQERGVMTSPVDGVVLERFIQNEQFLPAGTKLLEIGRLADIEVEADVLSLDVVTVQPGDRVEIYGPAVGEPPARGTVKNIYPAGFTKVSSLGVEQQRVRVIIAFEPSDLARLLKERHLEVGYRVRTRIITAEKPNALVVPRSALFRGMGSQWQLYVVREGRAEIAQVKLGLSNDSWAEVTDGLAEGDEVVVAPETNLSPGQRVAMSRR